MTELDEICDLELKIEGMSDLLEEKKECFLRDRGWTIELEKDLIGVKVYVNHGKILLANHIDEAMHIETNEEPEQEER